VLITLFLFGLTEINERFTAIARQLDLERDEKLSWKFQNPTLNKSVGIEDILDSNLLQGK